MPGVLDLSPLQSCPRFGVLQKIPPQVSPLSAMLFHSLPQPRLHISLDLCSLLERDVLLICGASLRRLNLKRDVGL